MTLPTLKLELDLGNPGSTPTWSADITPYLRAWASNRGAAQELQRVEAATATVVLDALDGRFIPMNTSSPYYPNLLPMRRMRLRADVGGTMYPVWQMYVEAWPASFPSGVDQVVEVSLVDGFKVLALATVSGSFSSQLSGARVGAILDAISWPSADRDIETGHSTIAAVTLTNAPVLEHLQAVELAEGGRLFMTRDGKVAFRQRGTPSVSDFTGRTWADDGSGLSYRDIVLTFDDRLIINDARLTRTGGTQQTAASSSSQTKYFTRSFVQSDIVLSTDNEVADLAAELVSKYGEPQLRIESLEDNALRHGFWADVLSRELYDRVLVKKTPAGSSSFSQDSFLQGIADDWRPGEWRRTLNVSPTNAAAQWILNDSVLSILDSTTYLSR